MAFSEGEEEEVGMDEEELDEEETLNGEVQDELETLFGGAFEDSPENVAEDEQALASAVLAAKEVVTEITSQGVAADHAASFNTVVTALDTLCREHEKRSNTVNGYKGKVRRFLGWVRDNNTSRPFTLPEVVLYFLMTVIKPEGTRRRKDGEYKALTAAVLAQNVKGELLPTSQSTLLGIRVSLC